MRAVRRIRGSSLVTVILVILVLTIIGVAIAYFTQVEDRLAGNTRMKRASFYVAESGLRKGESVINALYVHVNDGTDPNAVNNALAYGNPKITVPGGLPGDWQAVLLHAVDPEDGVTKDFGLPPLAIKVPGTEGVIDRGQFSLYIRNNIEDVTGDEITDKDVAINLISLGQIILPGAAGTVMTTILEEQLLNSCSRSSTGPMKNVDPSSSNVIATGNCR